MLIILFLLLMGGAISSLFLGIRWRKGVLCLVATILFIILSFNAYRIEIPTGGIILVFEDVIFVVVAWIGVMISVILTIFSAIAHMKKKLDKPRTGSA